MTTHEKPVDSHSTGTKQSTSVRSAMEPPLSDPDAANLLALVASDIHQLPHSTGSSVPMPAIRSDGTYTPYVQSYPIPATAGNMTASHTGAVRYTYVPYAVSDSLAVATQVAASSQNANPPAQIQMQQPQYVQYVMPNTAQYTRVQQEGNQKKETPHAQPTVTSGNAMLTLKSGEKKKYSCQVRMILLLHASVLFVRNALLPFLLPTFATYLTRQQTYCNACYV